jgi:hypothetical protein
MTERQMLVLAILLALLVALLGMLVGCGLCSGQWIPFQA